MGEGSSPTGSMTFCAPVELYLCSSWTCARLLPITRGPPAPRRTLRAAPSQPAPGRAETPDVTAVRGRFGSSDTLADTGTTQRGCATARAFGPHGLLRRRPGTDLTLYEQALESAAEFRGAGSGSWMVVAAWASTGWITSSFVIAVRPVPIYTAEPH